MTILDEDIMGLNVLLIIYILDRVLTATTLGFCCTEKKNGAKEVKYGGGSFTTFLEKRKKEKVQYGEHCKNDQDQVCIWLSGCVVNLWEA